MRIKLFVVVYLFLFYIYIFPQSKTTDTKTKKSDSKVKQEIVKKDRVKEISEKIEESIYNLKYSQDFFKKRDALNYIFDNIDLAMPIIEEALEDEEDDILISNLIQIVDISERDLTPGLVNKLIQRNNDKPSFVYNFLKYLNHKEQKSTINTLINSVFKSKNNLEPKYSVLRFIRENRIGGYEDFLIDYLLKTRSFFLSQEILSTLSFLNVESGKLKNLISFLGSIDGGVRSAAVILFGNYPDLVDLLIDNFYKSDDFFFKDSVIKVLSFYSNEEKVLSFFLENIEDNIFQNTIVLGLLGLKIEKKEIINKLIDFYNKSDIPVKSIIMNVFSLSFNNLSDDIKSIILNFVKNELNNAYYKNDEHALYFILKCILNMKYDDKQIDRILLLLKEDPPSWIIEKTVVQILDLKR